MAPGATLTPAPTPQRHLRRSHTQGPIFDVRPEFLGGFHEFPASVALDAARSAVLRFNVNSYCTPPHQ